MAAAHQEVYASYEVRLRYRLQCRLQRPAYGPGEIGRMHGISLGSVQRSGGFWAREVIRSDKVTTLKLIRSTS